MALEIRERPGTVPSPDIDVGVHSPDIKPVFQRQLSDTEYSPMDTPRKNKRKLSEPKRRTTDFSIKRFCPDSPGSACSESGRSEESTPERPTPEDLRESPRSDPSPGIPGDKDAIHPHLRPPFMFSDMRSHPYFIPQFYYNRFPGFPGSEQLSVFPGYAGLPNVPVPQPPTPQQHQKHHHQQQQHQASHTAASTEHSVSASSSNKKRNSSAKNTDNSSESRAAGESATTSSISEHSSQALQDDDNDSSDDVNRDSKKCRKNYKNMTRERRVEANARERSRVHTISAAFEGLRRAVPSYSYNQKLSKLAILRIACSYINALTKLTDDDESETGLQDTSFAECVDSCTRTIQTEGKARRRH